MFIHTGEKPFNCKQCRNRFSKKNSMDVHMRSRAGEKPSVVISVENLFRGKQA